MNRNSEMRSDPTPRLSDLRESGTLEQDADIVLFVWHREGEEGDSGKTSSTKIKIAKQRNGPIGTVDALFFKESMRFENKL
jgi:replicative DNA helicase